MYIKIQNFMKIEQAFDRNCIKDQQNGRHLKREGNYNKNLTKS